MLEMTLISFGNYKVSSKLQYFQVSSFLILHSRPNEEKYIIFTYLWKERVELRVEVNLFSSIGRQCIKMCVLCVYNKKVMFHYHNINIMM